MPLKYHCPMFFEIYFEIDFIYKYTCVYLLTCLFSSLVTCLLISKTTVRIMVFQNTKTIFYSVICNLLIYEYFWPSRLSGGLQNIPTASLQRGKTSANGCPDYDTKQSDGEAPVMLELWGMQSTSLWPSLLSLLWPG